MGLIDRVLGVPAATSAIGAAATTVAEVFVPNATKAMEAQHQAYIEALNQHGEEFRFARNGLFDRIVTGLNRLPRPFLALGTIGLFVYAMVDPQGFTDRMVGLNHVPEPLWWLLAAIVGFYFGAREAFYFRNRPLTARASSFDKAGVAEARGDENSALAEWRRLDGD